MKKLLLILPLLLCACAQTPTRVDIPGTDSSASVPVNDLRPASEKTSEIFSYLVSSSGYGIYRKGDETLDPPMTQIFRRRVLKKLSADGKTLDISIRHMVVYFNVKVQNSARGSYRWRDRWCHWWSDRCGRGVRVNSKSEPVIGRSESI